MFVTYYVLAFCGECEWSERVETPTQAEQAKLIRHALAHRATGHVVGIERGQGYDWR